MRGRIRGEPLLLVGLHRGRRGSLPWCGSSGRQAACRPAGFAFCFLGAAVAFLPSVPLPVPRFQFPVSTRQQETRSATNKRHFGDNRRYALRYPVLRSGLSRDLRALAGKCGHPRADAGCPQPACGHLRATSRRGPSTRGNGRRRQAAMVMEVRNEPVAMI